MSKTWRYQLDRAFRHGSPHLLGVSYSNEWIDIRHGAILIHRGYAWDGCSPAVRLPGGIWLGTPDGPLMADGRPQTFCASLVHDALCQWADEIPIRQAATLGVFEELLQEAGFPGWRIWLYVQAVKRFGPQAFGGDRPIPAAAID